jgi:hypothetical protein
MAAPAAPQNLQIQQGNGDIYLTWDASTGATSYKLYRSTNNSSFSLLTSPTVPYYLDESATANTRYWFYVIATNSDGDSAASDTVYIVPTAVGKQSLYGLRLQAKQRADRVNSSFVADPEWNSYINASAYELRDLLVNTYEDYYMATAHTFVTDGSSSQYALPSDFEKLLGVDMGLGGGTTGYITLHKFDFIERNNYVFPQVTSQLLGVFNPRYRLMADNLFMIPTPSGGQTVRVWYIPRMSVMLQDTDVLDGVSGWEEYVIVDAAIKALQKEESTEAVQVLMAQKQALIKRIEESAMNRDAGQPDTISPTRRWNGSSGPMGGF